jgi:hypothetical protein
MPEDVPPEVKKQIDLDVHRAGSRIEKLAEKQWDSTFANPKSKAYLGRVINDSMVEATQGFSEVGLIGPDKVTVDQAIDLYLRERGGQYITWLGESGKEDFRNLMLKSYRESGTFQNFDKLFRQEYPQWQKWKSLQIWRTEQGVASNNATFAVMEAYPEHIIGFRIILGPNPCPFCQYQASYDHEVNDQRPSYHVGCNCGTEPLLKGVHAFRDRGKNPDEFMNPTIFERMQKNYEGFKKGPTLMSFSPLRSGLSIPESRGMTQAELEKISDKYFKELALQKDGPEIIQDLRNYTEIAYQDVNGYLAQSGKWYDQLKKRSLYSQERTKYLVERYSTAISKSVLPQEVTVFRGTSQRVLTKLETAGALQEGAVIEMPTFMSTSFSKKVATDFMKVSTEPTIFEFQLKKNSEALPIFKHSSHPNELELLVQRNSKFKYVEKRKEADLVIHVWQQI